MSTGARGLLTLVALVVVAYLPFIGGGLLTDDFVHLDRFGHVQVGEVVNTPDAFGFFRPVTQLSLYIEAVSHPSAAWMFRLTNLVLHGLVLTAAFAVSQLLLRSASAAALTTLIFALTPKAHPIAVLWISARGELLMSLFALVATAAWTAWTRFGGRVWLTAAIVAYGLAILSKETAFLLPAVLLVVPGATVPLRQRAAAAGAMAGVAALAFLWRIEAGALVMSTSDPHYTLATPLFRWGRNARNYVGRLLPEPLAAVVVLGIASLLQRRWRKWGTGMSNEAARQAGTSQGIAVFAVGWIAAFLMPVLPVVLRNELYLYVPAFGVSFLAAHLITRWLDLASPPFTIRAVTLMFAIAAGAYQSSRSWELHGELVFSGQLVEALSGIPRPAVVSLDGDDDNSRRLLKDAIGGYLPAVLRVAAPDGRLIAGDPDGPGTPGVIRLRCGYHDGRLVMLRN